MPIKITFENENGKFGFYVKDQIALDTIVNTEYFNSKIVDARTGKEFTIANEIKTALKLSDPTPPTT